MVGSDPATVVVTPGGVEIVAGVCEAVWLGVTGTGPCSAPAPEPTHAETIRRTIHHRIAGRVSQGPRWPQFPRLRP